MSVSERLMPLLRSAVIVSGAFLLYVMATMAAAAATGSPVAAAGGGALVVATLWVVLRRADTGSWRPGAPSAVMHDRVFLTAVAGAFVLCWCAGQLAAVWLAAHVGSSGWDERTATQEGTDPVLLALVALLLAPLGEEALVRGVLYGRLRRHMPVIVAAVLSALVFSLLHGNIVQIAATLPVGVLLALVHEATGRLWPCVLMHMCFNLLAVVVPAALVQAVANPVVVMLAVLGAACTVSVAWIRMQAPGALAPVRRA